jgi:hypothetical protein
MCRRNLPLAALSAMLILSADETTRKPEEYPARMTVGNVTIAAENLGPGVPTPSGGILARDYITIEVALFEDGLGHRADISQRQFALRINGATTLLRPDTPGAVAASIKYPDWEEHPTLVGTAGAGNGEVIIGRPQAVERFPGDHRPAEQQGGGPMPRVDNPVAKKADPATVDELVTRAALPEGDVALPISGCLYFPYKKKLKTIKKLELVYAGPLGEGTLRIP